MHARIAAPARARARILVYMLPYLKVSGYISIASSIYYRSSMHTCTDPRAAASFAASPAARDGD
jgi:hypothetical protein